MGGADAVDIQPLHQQKITAQIFFRLAPTITWVGVVVIDTVQLDGSAVDQQLALW